MMCCWAPSSTTPLTAAQAMTASAVAQAMTNCWAAAALTPPSMRACVPIFRLISHARANGNAGTVAKLLGAVFGQSSISNKAYVGIGLKYLYEGMSYVGLAALALQAAGKSTPKDVALGSRFGVRSCISPRNGRPDPNAADLFDLKQ